MSVSDRIRNRLKSNSIRYFANDNISSFIEDDEIPQIGRAHV